MLDVQPEHLTIIRKILKQVIPHRKIVAFGSRMKGTAKKTSDLDLCVMGDALSFEKLAELRDAFSLSIIPYKIDIVEWVHLSPAFQTIIETDGVPI